MTPPSTAEGATLSFANMFHTPRNDSYAIAESQETQA